MAGVYRPRHPERTVLYRVLFHYFDRFLADYEGRFEKEYGFCPSCHAKRLEEWGEWMREMDWMDYLEFIARTTSHIPDKGQVTVRYYGLYANSKLSSLSSPIMPWWTASSTTST